MSDFTLTDWDGSDRPRETVDIRVPPDRDYLITGGTGSLGHAIVRELVRRGGNGRIIVYSRDEYKQWEMRKAFRDNPRLRFFIGDVRDRERLGVAMGGRVNVVIHAAAMKRVEAVEFNPIEAVRTNVDGTANVLDASRANGVGYFMFVSSDKAHDPACLYGSTKSLGERLTLAYRSYATHMRLSAVRLANIAGSRGSIVDAINRLGDGEPVSVTDLSMTRFWMSRESAARFCLDAVDEHKTGLLEPDAMAVSVSDIVAAFADGRELRLVGKGEMERDHEFLKGIRSDQAPRMTPSEIAMSVA